MSDATRAKELLGELAAERQRGLNTRRIVMGSILGMVLLAVGNFYIRVKTFDNEAFVTELERQASTTVWPMVSRELDAIAEDAVPAISDALAAQAETLMPRISETLAGESVLFQEHLVKKMTASLDSAFAAAASKHGDALKTRFPQFAADQSRYDELLKRLSVGGQQWAQGQLDSTFKEHVAVLQSINEQVQVLAAQAAASEGKRGEMDMEGVMTMFLEIMNSRLEGEG